MKSKHKNGGMHALGTMFWANFESQKPRILAQQEAPTFKEWAPQVSSETKITRLKNESLQS